MKLQCEDCKSYDVFVEDIGITCVEHAAEYNDCGSMVIDEVDL